MKALILFGLFLIAMLLEILTDSFDIKKKKLPAHIFQIITYVCYFFIGVYVYKVYSIGWDYLWLVLGFALLRFGVFNPILNWIMGWSINYKGKTDYFDLLRSYLDQSFDRFIIWLGNKNFKFIQAFLYILYLIVSIIFYPACVFFSIIIFNQM